MPACGHAVLRGARPPPTLACVRGGLEQRVWGRVPIGGGGREVTLRWGICPAGLGVPRGGSAQPRSQAQGPHGVCVHDRRYWKHLTSILTCSPWVPVKADEPTFY